MSAIIATSFRQWRACREAFEEYRESAYLRAHEATAGVLLNKRGQASGVDPWSLSVGPEIRARAYASEELLEHWETSPRVTYERFERTCREDPEAGR